jgi:hypothetical protein
MAISLADPGGPIEAVKESSAAIKTVLEAAQGGGYGDFAQGIAADVGEKAKQRQNPMAGFRPKGAQGARADPRRAPCRQCAADREDHARGGRPASRVAEVGRPARGQRGQGGGFIGFNAQRVSEGEQQMLDKLGEVFNSPAA